MYIESPYRKKLIDDGVAEIVTAEVIVAFDKYLRTLRWHPTSLDWRSMPAWDSFRLSIDNEADAIEWARSMAIGKHSHVVAVYKWDEPGLGARLDDAIHNLGALFTGAPGKRFFFGANLSNTPEYHFGDLMEFDGGEVLVAVR